MIPRAVRSLAVASVAALAGMVAPAAAEFRASDMNDIVMHLASREDLSAAQQKVADQVAAAAGKTYATYSQELAAWAKLAGALQKAFPGDAHMPGLLAALCDDGSGIDDAFFNLVFGTEGKGAAAVALTQHFGTSDPKAVAKAAKLLYGKVDKHFVKATSQSDCAKKLKFWSKAAKGAEGILKKYPLST